MKKLVCFLKRSLLLENAPLVLFLGLCPLLGASSSLASGLGMGVCTLLVLVLSGFVISLAGRFIPESVRSVSYMVIIAFFAALLELLLRAFLPVVYESLGIYLPLVAVSGIAFARAESAEREGLGTAVVQGFSMGLGFLAVILVMSLIRELVGQGTFFGIRVIPEEYAVRLIASPFGALVILGLLLAIFRKLVACVREKEGEQ